jgi:hypothetical protein
MPLLVTSLSYSLNAYLSPALQRAKIALAATRNITQHANGGLLELIRGVMSIEALPLPEGTKRCEARRLKRSRRLKRIKGTELLGERGGTASAPARLFLRYVKREGFEYFGRAIGVARF